MAALKVYSLGRLARHVTDSTMRNLRNNYYRTSALYSTEEKPVPEGEKPKDQPVVKTETEPLPATIEECHKKIEALSTELVAAKTSINELEDKYKRALADGENMRRRMVKQVEDAKQFAIQSFCKDLLDVADTLSAAAESIPHEGQEDVGAGALRQLHEGLRLTRSQLAQVFARHGLVAVSPLREKFDPNLHEALFQQAVEGAEPGTVVAVSKVGYKLHGRCVRPALVGVAKPPS